MPAQKDFSISRQKRLSMPAMWVCVPGAQFSIWSSNKFLVLVTWSRVLHFWREPKINSRYYWRCQLSWQVLFQQREMRIYWRLCNNSAIHLCLWKVWSLVVCSQSSFYVTRARKDDTNRQNTLFLCQEKMNLVPNKQLLLIVPFQSTKYRQKELCVDNKVQETIGDVYCLTCRNKKCVYISANKTTSFYDCKNATLAATSWRFLLRTRNRQLYCSAGTVHIFLQKRRVVTRKRKNHLHFWRNFSANHNEAHLNLNQKRLKWVQKWNKPIRFPLFDDLSHLFKFQINLFNFNLQSTSQLSANVHKIIMILSVSNEGIQWTLDFGPDSLLFQ